MSTYARYFNTYAEYEASDVYNASYPVVVYIGEDKVIATNETNAPLITIAHQKSWIPSTRDYMTVADAEAVTTINISGNTTLINFREFRYFTGVTSIIDQLFLGCTNLEYIELPKTITSIGEKAFTGCSKLKIINIPNTVTTISQEAFENCSQLQELTIPSSVTSIGDEICYNCSSLSSVNINTTNITEIPYKAFSYCTSLIDVNISYTVTEIAEEAFSYCTSLKNISIPKISNLPSATTTFGDKCFCGCSQLESFNIPDSTTTLGEEMFAGCTNLKNVGFIQKYDLGNAKLTTLSDAIFSGCKSLQTFVMPHSVTTIPAYAFSYCTSLKDVTISPSITSINMTAFDNCTSLTDLRIRLTTPPTLTGSFDALHTITKSLQRIHIPKGSKTDYEHEWRTIIGSDIQFIEFSNIFTDL